MAKRSAGILPYRFAGHEPQVLLVHPGGPFWQTKDEGAWSIPKGEFGEREDPLSAARREFAEELGAVPPIDGYRSLGDVRQGGGKVVSAWAIEGYFDPARLSSNKFEIEWPPRSGRRQSFPEVDRVQWFRFARAYERILAGQRPFLDRLNDLLGVSS